MLPGPEDVYFMCVPQGKILELFTLCINERTNVIKITKNTVCTDERVLYATSNNLEKVNYNIV